jgi:uncharacterized membrane protein YraQ (UPF0718 family)
MNFWQQQGREARLLLSMSGIFLLIYFLPLQQPRFENSLLEGLRLTQWYAREHVILCLLPAFVIAGAMAAYISQGAVLKHLGPQANKVVALSVASVSGTLLAVCSCTVLPLFGGIYRRGAGLGAATAFLYSGPAINVMAIVVTAKVLGAEIGIARAVGAISFALIIGMLMQWIYRHEEAQRASKNGRGFGDGDNERPVGDIAALFGLMIGILVFANWAPADSETWMAIFQIKWMMTGLLAVLLAGLLIERWKWPAAPLVITGLLAGLVGLLFPDWPELAMVIGIGGLMLQASRGDDESREWIAQSWDFTNRSCRCYWAVF